MSIRWIIVGLLGAFLFYKVMYIFGRAIGKGVADGLASNGFFMTEE